MPLQDIAHTSISASKLSEPTCRDLSPVLSTSLLGTYGENLELVLPVSSIRAWHSIGKPFLILDMNNPHFLPCISVASLPTYRAYLFTTCQIPGPIEPCMQLDPMMLLGSSPKQTLFASSGFSCLQRTRSSLHSHSVVVIP